MKILFIGKNQWLIDYVKFFAMDSIEVNSSDWSSFDFDNISVNGYDLLIMPFYAQDERAKEKLELVQKAASTHKVLVLSELAPKEILLKASQHGAAGILELFEAEKSEIGDCLEQIMLGNNYFSPRINQFVFDFIANKQPLIEGDDSLKIVLTKREIQIMKLIANGYTNEDLSYELNISPFTVKNHKKNLLRKIDCRNSAEMVKFGFANGILQ